MCKVRVIGVNITTKIRVITALPRLYGYAVENVCFANGECLVDFRRRITPMNPAMRAEMIQVVRWFVLV